MKKKQVILLICVVLFLVGFIYLTAQYRNQSIVLLDSRVVASLTYSNKEDETKVVHYYFIKTTYSADVTIDMIDLNDDAFRPLFNPDNAVSAKEMKIRDWYGCLYTFPNKSYLCWTVSPEASYALEYTPADIDDESIIKIANSAVPFRPSK